MNNDYKDSLGLNDFHQYVETETLVIEKRNQQAGQNTGKKQGNFKKSFFTQRVNKSRLELQKNKRSASVANVPTTASADEELSKPTERIFREVEAKASKLPVFENLEATNKPFELSEIENDCFGLTAPAKRKPVEEHPVLVTQKSTTKRSLTGNDKKAVKSKEKSLKTVDNDDLPKAVNKKNKLKEVGSFLLPTLLALLIAVGLRGFVFTNTTVPTGSMLNTIQIGSRLIGSKLSYDFGKVPERFDIVIFKYPDNEKQDYVKRVIGLPGETVEIIDGKVYINGSSNPLKDNFVTTGTPTGNYGPYKVPANSYFMLGDNRENSNDSRFWTKQFVHEDKITAKVIFQYYPSIKSID